eukprot:Nitzschia sp. Nitz4//scaffold236_size30323//9997//12576//NITZ4_007986-RA/size30323-snap-gene-0.34-mRNA-1//-1//CDS//3329543487//984//frame0
MRDEPRTSKRKRMPRAKPSEVKERPLEEIAPKPRRRAKLPPVLATDMRVDVPEKDGVKLTDEYIEQRIAFCCQKCFCSEKKKGPLRDDPYVQSGEGRLWHRRCCHGAFECNEAWATDYEVICAQFEKMVIEGNLPPPTEPLHVNYDYVYERYQTVKRQESALYNDDELEGHAQALLTNEEYLLNLKAFRKYRDSQPSPPPKAVVLDLFGGIGAAIVCLKRLNIAIQTVLHVEHDKVANAVYRANHCTDESGHHVMVSSFERLEQNLVQYHDRYGPFDIVIGGPPCVDYAAINANRRGIQGVQGSYFPRMGMLVRRIQELNQNHPTRRPVFFLAENAILMNAEDAPLNQTERSFVEHSFGVTWSLQMDSRLYSPIRRNRTYISNIPCLDLKSHKDPPPRTCLDDDYQVAGNIIEPDMITKAPGLMAVLSRLDDTPRMEIFQKSTNEEGKTQFLCRTPTVLERERLMGFPEGYVSKPVKTLYNALLNDGVAMCFERPDTSNGPSACWKDCLDPQYKSFAGDYHRMNGDWKYFEYEYTSDGIGLKLTPHLQSNSQPSYYNAEEYSKRLLGNSFSIPTVEMLLAPLAPLFASRRYSGYDYAFAWEKEYSRGSQEVSEAPNLSPTPPPIDSDSDDNQFNQAKSTPTTSTTTSVAIPKREAHHYHETVHVGEEGRARSRTTEETGHLDTSPAVKKDSRAAPNENSNAPAVSVWESGDAGAVTNQFDAYDI